MSLSSKFRGEWKKTISEKSSSTKFLIYIERINVQKISQIGDGHWSLKKKSEKIKISKFRRERKNKFGKNSSTKFLYSLGESIFKKSAKSEMVTGRLVDSYEKPLLTES
jgi:hypothetical protein